MLLLPMLAGSRWPVVDMLAWAERHVFATSHEVVVQLTTRWPLKADCLPPDMPLLSDVATLAKRVAGEEWPKLPEAVQHPHINMNEDSRDMIRLAGKIGTGTLTTLADHMSRRCMPL